MGYTCKNKRKNGINIVQVGIGVFTLILVCFIVWPKGLICEM